MPIKLPRGFTRRKSSGNALEELPNPPEPSFRVFERPRGGSRSFDGGITLKRLDNEQPTIAGPEYGHDGVRYLPTTSSEGDLVNRDSHGIYNSTAITAPYSSAASSARQSSSSTIPSSTDMQPEPSVTLAFHKPSHGVQPPPPPQSRHRFSILPSSRTFSSPTIAQYSSSPTTITEPKVPNQHSDGENRHRQRAMTTSTASTATPPRILDADVTFDEAEFDDFGNMFDSIGMHGSKDASPKKHTIKSSMPPTSFPSTFRQPSPVMPVLPDLESSPVVSSPHSVNSYDSREPYREPSSPITVPRHKPLPPAPTSSPPPQPKLYVSVLDNSHHEESYIQHDDTMARRQNPPSMPMSPPPFDGEDARLLTAMTPPLQSCSPGPEYGNPRRDRPSHEDELKPRLATYSQANDATYRTVRGHHATASLDSVLDPSLAASAQLAAQWEAIKPPPAPASFRPMNKVMTRAQFERLRLEQELTRQNSVASQGVRSGNGSDDEDDEDELERGRQAARQRRKQEAHLAVYRQKMMKVTGESSSKTPSTSSGFPSYPGSRIPSASTSVPELTSRESPLGMGATKFTANGKVSGDEEEDEDVPLGILAAHGFPNKNRPPRRLSDAAPVQAPISGEANRQEIRSNLPVFARKLPQDPYFGASLVNASNREQFTMGGGAPMHSAPAVPLPGMHPGGLVGVIAGEERARALRRGSPIAQNGYDALAMQPPRPGMPRSQTMANTQVMGYPGMAPGMIPGMAPGTSPVLSPSDQAQIQMAQQMTQMMQMQMQWMQQMSQMQVGQQAQQTQQGPPVLPQVPQQSATDSGVSGPEHPSQIPRPLSMPLPSSPREEQSTMDNLKSNMAPWNRSASVAATVRRGGVEQRYAPSIAPSERSNVGLAPRYRPVYTLTDPAEKTVNRASTFTSSTFQPWSNNNASRRSSNGTSVGYLISNAKKPRVPVDDDDDDQGWAEMKKKRDEKKSAWQMRKMQNELKEMYHPGI